MAEPIKDLSRARILVANDDGITAPGIKLLERVARSLSKDVWVVAPETEQSAVAHSLTLRRPLRIRQVSTQRYCVDGTPTDSVLLAIREIMKDSMPDLLLSGVNLGANLADDVTYSGTVAAAMEGTILGVPSIALSQLVRGRSQDPLGHRRDLGPEVIRAVSSVGWPTDVLINVNFPDLWPQGEGHQAGAPRPPQAGRRDHQADRSAQAPLLLDRRVARRGSRDGQHGS